MPSKPSSPGPSTTPATPAKQTRSRKSTIPNQTEQERAGSAGGVMLPKETAAKASPSSAKKAAATAPGPDDASVTEVKTPKRKPRKLNKDPATNPADTTKSPISNETTSNSELEALKSRVKGLEAKVEELYKSGAILDSRGGRSPRRRGKGRKGSSTTQVPQVNTTDSDVGATSARVQELDDDLDADEELVRLEGELEVARQDLEHYRPRARRSRSDETEFVEEIPRGGTADRQVTLSGSYRIPIPASVNLQDVQTIKSGVSAAQNVARSFLEQRRASAAAARAQSATQDAPPPTTRSSTTNVPTSKTRPKRSMSSNMEVSVDNSSGKQSWSDWIGGYSMAISRAVSKIEHEAAIEAQRSSAAATGGSGRKTSAPTSRKTAGKRPAAKATLSGEQVHGLMS